MKSFEPTISEPAGDPKLLLKDIIIESKSLTILSAAIPLPTEALKSLVPSICNGMPFDLAYSAS